MYTGCVEWPPFRSVPVLSAITQVSWSKSVTLLPVTDVVLHLALATCGNPSYQSLDKLLMFTRIDYNLRMLNR